MSWLKSCPFGSGCEEECPLRALRDLPVEQAYAKIIRMNDSQVLDIEQIHAICKRQRTQPKG